MDKPEIFIREIKPEDAAAVTNLSRQLGYGISADQTKRNIETINKSENIAAFAVIYNNELAGWISIAYTISITSPPVCEVRGLVVDERYRKNNIGRILIEKVIEWSKQKKCNQLRIRCNVKREEAHAFYRHLGFTEHKQQKVFEIDI